MPLAYHCIFSAYGFWLPNDPRGSGSNFVANPDLYAAFGPATKVHSRHSVASRTHDTQHRQAAKKTLRHTPARFTGQQAQAIASAFAQTPYRFYALAIMPDHVHLVTPPSRQRSIRAVVGHLKSQATRALRKQGHFVQRPVWAAHGWNVALQTPDDVRRTLRYVQANPLKAGHKPQRWSCVQPFIAP